MLADFVCKAPREGIDVSRQAVDHVCAWGSNPKEGGDGALFLRHRAPRSCQKMVELKRRRKNQNHIGIIIIIKGNDFMRLQV